MKLGTQIRFSDGREATVVYNGLIGVGIMWGRHDPDPEDFKGTDGNLTQGGSPKDWKWEPEALLRHPSEKYPNLFLKYGFTDDQCVGDDYNIIRVGLCGT